LKADTEKTIKSLLRSSHKVLMITGDAPLTASAVARSVNIASNDIEKTYTLHESGTKWCPILTSPGKKEETVMYEEGLVQAQKGLIDLIITGTGMEAIMNAGKPLYDAAILTKVWARVSPSQKAQILQALKDGGHITLMCGDGKLERIL
jgi:cation-transporting ATPase 13A1